MALPDAAALVDRLCSSSGESEWVEFKKDCFEPDYFGEYVSALSNSAVLEDKHQAFMLFGIDGKSHEVLGTKVRLKTEKVGGEPFEHYLARFC